MKRVLLIASLVVGSSSAFAAPASKACVEARRQARADYQRIAGDAELRADDGQISKSAAQQLKDTAALLLSKAEDFCAWDADIVR